MPIPTWQAGALLQAGKCRERLGEDKEAAELYQRILKTYPKRRLPRRPPSRLKRLEKVDLGGWRLGVLTPAGRGQD